MSSNAQKVEKNTLFAYTVAGKALTFAPDFKITVCLKAHQSIIKKGKKKMKKIFAIALVAMMTMTANAQVYVGGGVGFATASNDGNTATNLKFIPEIGYNLNEDWAIGIALGYAQNETKVNGNETKVKSFQVSPYARYTFARFDKVNLFIDGGVGFQQDDADGLKTNTFTVGLTPGLAVNLNDKLSFVTHFGFLGYTNTKLDVDGAKATNAVGFDLDGSSLSFGVYYNF